MSPSAMVNSTSTDRAGNLRLYLQAMMGSWRAKALERMVMMGAGGYILSWVALPVFQLITAGLIYRGVRPDLLSYTVITIAASSFIFNAQYYIGEILDGERMHGTLAGLFLAPCSRLSWLTGFALGGLLETIFAAAVTLVFGMILFQVRFHPNYPSLILTTTLFLLSLWGLGFILSAIGLVIKRSNDLSNLLSPFIFLLGGIYYPVSLLPLWLRIPAHVLPLGYGMQALADAALHDASISTLLPNLLPLAGFAAALPCAGVLVFGWLERRVRERGELDLY